MNNGSFKAGDLQGSSKYPGIDPWQVEMIPKGTVLVQFDFRDPTIIEKKSEVVSKYFSDIDCLNRCRSEKGEVSARLFAEGVQVKPRRMVEDVGPHIYPRYVSLYEVKQDIQVEKAKVENNPVYGDGGFNEYYIDSDPRELLTDRVLEFKGTIELSDRTPELTHFTNWENEKLTDMEIEKRIPGLNHELLNGKLLSGTTEGVLKDYENQPDKDIGNEFRGMDMEIAL